MVSYNFCTCFLVMKNTLAQEPIKFDGLLVSVRNLTNSGVTKKQLYLIFKIKWITITINPS